MGVNPVTTPSVATTTAASTPAQHEDATTQATTEPSGVTEKKPYTVELTGVALAKSLKLSGKTLAQIAQKMGLSVQVIDQYLGVTTKTATPATTSTQAIVAATYASKNNQTATATAQASGNAPNKG